MHVSGSLLDPAVCVYVCVDVVLSSLQTWCLVCWVPHVLTLHVPSLKPDVSGCASGLVLCTSEACPVRNILWSLTYLVD